MQEKVETEYKIGLHLYRKNPILFDGDPIDKKNIIFITRHEHAQLVTWWNRLIKDQKGLAK